MNSVSIVVPALNERPSLERLIPDVAAACNAASLSWELFVVDSDSDDGTRDTVEVFARAMPVVWLNETTRGDLALAWRRGIDAATKSLILTMDADLCHSPAFVPSLVAACDDADMAIASRYPAPRRTMPSKSILHEAASRAGQLLIRAVLRLPFADVTHGFRAFRRDLWQRIHADVDTPGNAFMVALTWHAHRAGFRIREIPYTYGARLHGRDHLNPPVETRRFLEFIFSARRRP